MLSLQKDTALATIRPLVQEIQSHNSRMIPNRSFSLLQSFHFVEYFHKEKILDGLDFFDTLPKELVFIDFNSSSDKRPGVIMVESLTSNQEKMTESTLLKPVCNIKQAILHLYREKGEVEWLDKKFDGNSNHERDKSSERNVLCALAIPGWLTPSDFLSFIGHFKENVSHFRIIRDKSPNRYMILMKFRSDSFATEFYSTFHGKRFSSLKPELCNLAHIKKVEFKASIIPPYCFLQDFVDDLATSASTLQELPTCPVCLERLDASISGVLTIQCQHSFHCSCLTKWGDSSCPVCRYSQNQKASGAEEFEKNECSKCKVAEDLWICLICGHIGCGRYHKAHAQSHFEQTSHLYALELETQRVWDYAGDNYVHRLIQNKADGKLVELPGPAISENPSILNQEKIDAITLEYNHLLTMQLNSQRYFYENQFSSVQHELEELCKKYSELEVNYSKVVKKNEELEKVDLPKIIQEKKELEKKLQQTQLKSIKLKNEWSEEAKLNEALRDNQKILQAMLQQQETNLQETKEQLRDVMFYISSQEKIQNNPLRQEIEQGKIEIVPTESGSPKRTIKRKGKRSG